MTRSLAALFALSVAGCTRERAPGHTPASTSPSAKAAVSPAASAPRPTARTFRSVRVADDVVRIPCVAFDPSGRVVVAYAERGGERALRVMRREGDRFTPAAPSIGGVSACVALRVSSSGVTAVVNKPGELLWGLDVVTIDASGRAGRRELAASNVTPHQTDVLFDGDRVHAAWVRQDFARSRFQLLRFADGARAPTALVDAMENGARFLGDEQHLVVATSPSGALGLVAPDGAVTPLPAAIKSLDFDTLRGPDGADIVARTGRTLVHVRVTGDRASTARVVAEAEEWGLYPHLVRGPRGLDVVYYAESAKELRRRRLGQDGWGPPDTIVPSDANEGFAAAIDQDGKLHLAVVDAAFRLDWIVEDR